MILVHPFAIKIDPVRSSERRFSWTVYENGALRSQSPVSYATRREAEANATKAMQKLIENWRSRKLPGSPDSRAS
jgi:hypothetical protein